MILPDFALTTRQNNVTSYGIDEVEHIHNKESFLNYLYPVRYCFNSRGFRDDEWPESLSDVIWCIGDSFTVGVGSAYNHIWPQVLQSSTGLRTINVSMDGASNEWILRHASRIVETVAPKNIVIMWSYWHRRENPDCTLPDERRRIYSSKDTDRADFDNFVQCINATDKFQTNIVHLTVPDSQTIENLSISWKNIRGEEWPIRPPRTIEDFRALPNFVLDEILNKFKMDSEFYNMILKNDWFNDFKNQKKIIETTRLDIARDGHHFDIITSKWLTDQIVSRLAK